MKLFLPSSLPVVRGLRLAVALPLAVCSLALFTGCASRSPATVIPASLRTSVAWSIAPQQATLFHIHSLPLYQQAEEAWRQKRFAEATALLQSLAQQKGMTVAEMTFVRQQRVTCLKDAGLPVPIFSTAARSTVHVLPFLASVSVPAASAKALLDADCGPHPLLCERWGKNDLAFPTTAVKTATAGTSLVGLSMAA